MAKYAKTNLVAVKNHSMNDSEKLLVGKGLFCYGQLV